MTERQQRLLQVLVDLYIKSAEPVSSQMLASAGNLDVSTATVRNDLALLEENGYVMQPHTSAGRIPTEKGYRFYIEWFVDKKGVAVPERRRLRAEARVEDATSQAVRRVARTIADLTGEAVIVSSGREPAYALGMAQLFAQPEFANPDMVLSLARLFDDVEECMPMLRRQLGADVHIFLGAENPFGNQLAAVAATYPVRGHPPGILGILGPSRMRYGYHVALLRESCDLIQSLTYV